MSPGSLPRRRRDPQAPPPKGVLSGEREPLFAYLPEEVQRNMQRRESESALVWEAFYPFAHAGISLKDWSSIRPLWGSPVPSAIDDRLIPYFWGLRVDGSPLAGLAEAAQAVAGREDRLEVDLYLKGSRVLVAIEAKTDGDPARCGRYEAGRCPEIHGGDKPCRYWDGPSTFDPSLDFGIRPGPGLEERPPCARHYQLARTLLMVENLGRANGLEPYLCLLIPRRRWPSLFSPWEDFAERVRDEAQWRRLRVVGWEDLEGLKGQWGM